MRHGERRSRLAQAGLMVGSLLMTLVLLEFMTRLVYGRSDQIAATYRQSYDGLHIADEALIFRMQPGYRGTIAHAEYSVDLAINSHGLRDREHAYEKDDGVYRIVILGDSFMAAIQTDLDLILPTLLEERLNEDPRTGGSGYRFEVINTGVSAYSTLNEYLMLREEGLRYEPDLVLYAFFPNDLDGAIAPALEGLCHVVVEGGVYVYARTDEQGNLELDESGEPELVEVSTEEALGQVEVPPGRRIDQWWVDHSKLYAVIRPAFRRVGPLWRAMRNVFREPDGEVFFDRAFAVNPPNAGQDRQITAFQQLSLMERDLSASHGAAYAVFSIPMMEQIYPEQTESAYLGFSLLGAYWQYDKIDRMLAGFYRGEEIPYLALADTLAGSAAASEEMLYFQHDRHLTPAGHRVATDAVYEWLVAAGLVPAAAGGG